jgi:hypothetical protein
MGSFKRSKITEETWFCSILRVNKPLLQWKPQEKYSSDKIFSFSRPTLIFLGYYFLIVTFFLKSQFNILYSVFKVVLKTLDNLLKQNRKLIFEYILILINGKALIFFLHLTKELKAWNFINAVSEKKENYKLTMDTCSISGFLFKKQLKK